MRNVTDNSNSRSGNRWGNPVAGQCVIPMDRKIKMILNVVVVILVVLWLLRSFGLL